MSRGLRPIIVTGPTGVGKSAFSLELAEKVGGEIVGADAFQIYRGLPILTAQPGPDLRLRVPHHLIGVIDIHETCHAARFSEMARQCIQDIQARGKVPILTGGTGLYLKALTHGLADVPPVNAELRAKISAMELQVALAALAEADREAPAQIDVRNPARVRRALEIVLLTGKPFAASRTWKSSSREFQGLLVVRDREELWKRIERNVDGMFAAGVVEEVRASGVVGAGISRAIGFQEIQALISGRMGVEECRHAIILATRRYAKRQETWCRHQFDFPLLPLAAPIPQLIESALLLLGSYR